MERCDNSDSIALNGGDRVVVELKLGGKISDTISLISEKYFVVGNYCVHADDVYSIRYWTEKSKRNGIPLEIVGGVLMAGGIALFIVGANSTGVGRITHYFEGALVFGSGLVCLAAGNAINATNRSEKRTFGQYWKLRID
jgi:hypothetical protein